MEKVIKKIMEKKKEKEKENVNVNDKEMTGRIINKFEEPIVSLYENWYSLNRIRKIPIMEFLKTEKFKDQVEIYRKSRDERERFKIKNNLECIAPSGIFFNWKEYSIMPHTGLICLNVNSEDNKGDNLERFKHIIGEDCPSLYYAGLSIGGKGIFLIFRISNPYYHNQHFIALVYYLKERFNLNVDRTIQRPISMRMASYDDNPYYNLNPLPFKYIKEIQSGPKSIKREKETREHIENAITEIKSYRIDITKQHLNNFKIGSALAYEFGEEGRNWFHIVSGICKNYNRCECDFEYDKYLDYNKGNIKIGTFFHYCKENGICYWK